jgi:predicted deacylase
MSDGVPSHIVDHLDVASLPTGAITRLRLDLVHDGMGRPVRLPIMVARGKKPGPVFGVTAAVHGNELNGIPVIHRLFQRVDLEHLRGAIVGVVVVNIPGMLGHRRDIAEGLDLNRIMPGRADGNLGQVYAHRLLDRVVRHFEYLVDLHTASRGRVNSLYVRADMRDSATAQMALLQRPQIIVHNRASDGTLRGAAGELRIPAITVEIGNPGRFQSEYVKGSLAGLRAVLAEAGMVARRPLHIKAKPVVCERSYWLYTEVGGLLDVLPKVTDHVEAGDVVARQTNIFGDVIREYRAPEAGVIVGHSIDPVAPSGARILHLGVVQG